MRPLVAPFAALLLACGPSPAQATAARAAAGPDPYTRSVPAAMASAGYVSFGPFPFGANHTTKEVDELLVDEPLLWIETAHFRIGCALRPLSLRSTEPLAAEWIQRTRRELQRLDRKLPRVDGNTKTLDPWLRAHLIAMRLEDLYAEVQANLGVVDADFPTSRPDDATSPEAYHGSGPFLGMRAKFRVLLLRRESDHARYTRSFQGREIADPVRDFDAAAGSLYWGASEDAGNGLYADDLALHASLAFNVAWNLYSGYRDYAHDLPAWLATGLGHWHARAVTKRFPVYERAYDKDRNPRSEFWDWEKRVKGLTRDGGFEPLPEFFARDDAGRFGLPQQIQAWALVDWLMRTRKAELMRFVHLLKEPFHARMRSPSRSDLLARQDEAHRAAFGTDADGLAAAWRESVLAR